VPAKLAHPSSPLSWSQYSPAVCVCSTLPLTCATLPSIPENGLCLSLCLFHSCLLWGCQERHLPVTPPPKGSYFCGQGVGGLGKAPPRDRLMTPGPLPAWTWLTAHSMPLMMGEGSGRENGRRGGWAPPPNPQPRWPGKNCPPPPRVHWAPGDDPGRGPSGGVEANALAVHCADRHDVSSLGHPVDCAQPRPGMGGIRRGEKGRSSTDRPCVLRLYWPAGNYLRDFQEEQIAEAKKKYKKVLRPFLVKCPGTNDWNSNVKDFFNSA